MPNQLLELEIEGMTCTACARRVEKNLNKLPGVTAYVDFATEKAHLQLETEVEKTQLEAAVEDAGYKVGSGRSELVSIKPKLYLGLTFAALSAAFGMIPWLSFEGLQYFLFALATPVVFYVAFTFHKAAFKNLLKLDSTMDTLVSLGTLVAYSYSVYLVFFLGHEHSYFEVATVVPAVVLLGRFLELRARRSATDAVRSLLSAIPSQSTLERDGIRVLVPTSDLRSGDIVLVAAGENLPVDGILLSDHASIDSSTLTGETLPQELAKGSRLTAGTISIGAELRYLATGSSASSRLSKIADLVREATAQKTKLAKLTDRISSVFVPSVIVLSILTYLTWAFILGNSETAFEAAVAVLVIACPCALGIAVPMSLTVATSLGAKRSVVIRNPDVLSVLSKADQIFFDKTGTLTDGELKIVNSVGLGGVSAATMLSYAAAVEKGSRHPVAKAIAKSSAEYEASDVKELPGSGVSGWVAGLEVFVEKPGSYQNQPELDGALSSAGPNTLVVVAWEGWAHGLIELSDELRPGAKEAVASLVAQGFEPVLLSGDNERRVSAIAEDLGIEKYFAGVTPEGKLEIIAKAKGSIMVGDGINDVAALSKASVGIAMGSGAQAAQAASAITILDDSPSAIPYSLRLAKRTHRNIWQNLGWAFGYNVLLIPVAAIGLLNPMLAGVAMAFSSVSVVVNSLRLRWQD
jgi:P-type Cu+ transporter